MSEVHSKIAEAYMKYQWIYVVDSIKVVFSTFW